jgi:protein disulfide-isomerase A1
MTTANILKFADGIVDGSIGAIVPSQDIPENDMDGDVKIVVGKSFEAIVKDPTKDVLLEVYAPWCGHCQNLEPIYAKLATRFKEIPSVVIAKMDGTENEVESLDVEGYPAIFFFPAEKNATGMSLTAPCKEPSTLQMHKKCTGSCPQIYLAFLECMYAPGIFCAFA